VDKDLHLAHKDAVDVVVSVMTKELLARSQNLKQK
jgi:hypothetical protein